MTRTPPAGRPARPAFAPHRPTRRPTISRVSTAPGNRGRDRVTTTEYVNQGAAIRLDRPETDAITDLSGAAPLTVTFGEFDRRASSLAQALAERHPRGATVGVLGENSLPWLIVFCAIQRAGLVAVPINYRQPAELVEYVVRDAGLAELFVDASQREKTVGLGDLPLTDLQDAWSASETPADFPPVQVDPEEPAMFLYTSGSTGKPKGVVLSHRSHLWVIAQGIEGKSRDSRLLISAPLYHMGALSPVQRAMGAGQSVVLLPRFEVTAVLDAIERYRITDLNGVPPMIAMLLQDEEGVARTDLSSVSTVILNSAPASKELLTELTEVFRQPRFVFTFGTTESGPVAFTAPADGRPVPLGSVGVPHPAVELRLVGADGAAAGDLGVLQIRCPGLMSGYHDRPDIPSPITADGYYHTNDLFQRDEEGFYSFIGRKDDMFVSGGENLYPRAIEIALESHPAVSQAAVVPVPDALKGTKPVAFVVAAAGAQLEEPELRQYSLTKLEPAAHPRRVWFIDELPLAATNKVDKKPLRDRALRELGLVD